MKKNKHGFTLIEVLLVMVIISIILYLTIGYVQQQALQNRIARTSAQMQQILNAALAYYVDNGKWPGPNGELKSPNPLLGRYLPTQPPVNSWGRPYFVYSYVVNSTNSRNFFLYTTIPAGATGSTSAQAAANTIAGLLPLANATGSTAAPPVTVTACGTGDCQVVTQVNIPGQNLNNATSVNFAGIYHHGACVPVPSCPTDSTGTVMTPQIMVVPVSVSGLNDNTKDNVYPISSFTAYAVGDTAGSTATPTTKTPAACTGSGTSVVTCTGTTSVNDANASAYWRVCLQVVTEKGDVQASPRTDLWGTKVSLMAITRCASSKEASGTVFSTTNGSN